MDDVVFLSVYCRCRFDQKKNEWRGVGTFFCSRGRKHFKKLQVLFLPNLSSVCKSLIMKILVFPRVLKDGLKPFSSLQLEYLFYFRERQGMCVRPQQCADDTLVFWPADGRCYYRLTQGPCYPGALLDIGSDGLANCSVRSHHIDEIELLTFLLS